MWPVIRGGRVSRSPVRVKMFTRMAANQNETIGRAAGTGDPVLVEWGGNGYNQTRPHGRVAFG